MIWKTSQNSQINTRSSHPEVFCQNVFLKILQNSQINIFAGVYFFIKLQGGNLKLSEAANGGILSKKVLFKRRTGISERAVHRSSWIIHKIHRKKPVLESLFNKVAFLRACNFSKEDSDTCAFPWNLQTF